MNNPAQEESELEVLAALGFGPEALITNEPRIFVDARLLAALLAELDDELDDLEARRILFQIGLLYGFRDAQRMLGDERAEGACVSGQVAEPTLLPISLQQQTDTNDPGALHLTGAFPECFEAEARLRKLGRPSKPSCALSAGYASGWLSGLFDVEILAVEDECSACGGERCSFVAREIETWRGESQRECLSLLPQLPYEAFRGVLRRAPTGNVDSLVNELDFDPSVVHVWGPVMILPFTNVDQALHTVEMLGREPDTSNVRAVVVDLRGETLDEGFGGAALEQALEAIESWGAEALLTNVSPAAEPLVSHLEARFVVLRKDLPEAVAAAFQIAEAQRHLL